MFISEKKAKAKVITQSIETTHGYWLRYIVSQNARL